MRMESMRMYQAAEHLMAEVDLLLPRARRAKPNAARHLESSAESVLFNTGEGIGSFRPKIKISTYEIARKEANEVRTILRRLVIAHVFTDREIEKAYNLAGAIVGMLTAAIITLEKRLEA